MLSDESQHFLISLDRGVSDRSTLASLVQFLAEGIGMFNHVVPNTHTRIVNRIDNRVVFEAIIRVVIGLGAKLANLVFTILLSVIHLNCIFRFKNLKVNYKK